MEYLIDKNIRSKIMSSIKCCNTKPELLLKKLLKDYEYQSKTFGRPDFINYKKRTVIFVDGCFWHQCPIHSKKPKQNKAYWIPKIKRNVTRAKEVEIAYKNSGWNVVRIWEHEINNNLNNCLKKHKEI